MFEYIWVGFLFGQVIGMGFVVRALALGGMRTSLLPKWLGKLGLVFASLGLLIALGPMWNGFWILGAFGYLLSLVWVLSLALALKLPHQKHTEPFVLSIGR